MRSNREIPVSSKRALAALAASNTLGVLALYLIPLIVGATTDGFGTQEGTAGIVSSWELGAMAAASMLLAARFRTLRTRHWSLIGGLAYVGGNLLCAWTLTAGQWYAFLIARGVVGAGEGILFGVSSGLAAQTAKPDRTFAWFAGCHVSVSLLCFWVMPAAVAWLGPLGAFATTAGAGALAAPLLLWTPAQSTERTATSAQPVERFGKAAVLLVLSVGCLNLGLNTLFPFTERIGVSLGLTLAEIGQILSLGALLSIAGPIAAGVFGARGGRTLSLGFGAASQAAGALILVYASSRGLWAASYVVTSMALMYFMPLLYGLVAFYDRTGRINAAAASMTAWTSAAGPLLSGLLLNLGGSYRLVGWLTAMSFAALFALAYQPSRSAERSRRAAPATSSADPVAQPSATT